MQKAGPLHTPHGAVVRNMGIGKVKGSGWMPLPLQPGKAAILSPACSGAISSSMTSLGSGGILCIGTEWKPELWTDPGSNLWAENHDVWLSGGCACCPLGDGSALLSFAFPMIFLWDIFISWPLAFTCVGGNRGHGERRELSGKVAPSTIFTAEEKVKGNLVRTFWRWPTLASGPSEAGGDI